MNTSLLSAVAIRSILAVMSVLIAALWTNQLLKITDEATEIVMAADDLDSFARTMAAGTAEPFDEKPPGTEASSGAAPEAPTGKQAVPPTASSATSGIAKTAPSTTQPDQSASPKPNQLHSRKQTVPPATEAATQHAGTDQFQPVTTGKLHSFSGQGLSESAEGDQSGGAGNVVWNIDLAGQNSIEQLARMRGTRLAAVRVRRSGCEIALVDGRRVSQPVSVERFVRDYPEFRSGQGIILDHRLLQDVQDRLLSYGPGWGLWLLVEDSLFATWVAQVGQRIQVRSRTWDEVAEVQARLEPGNDIRPPRFELRRIEYSDVRNEANAVEP